MGYGGAKAVFENEQRSLFESLLTVVETFTSAGYGEDAVWQPPSIGLLLATQFTGGCFVFTALPLFVAPWIEVTPSTTSPTSRVETPPFPARRLSCPGAVDRQWVAARVDHLEEDALSFDLQIDVGTEAGAWLGRRSPSPTAGCGPARASWPWIELGICYPEADVRLQKG